MAVLLAAVAVLAAACSSGSTSSQGSAGPTGHAARAAQVSWGASLPGAPACNPLGGQQCMLPFPSDYYTVADRAMPSGRRIDIPVTATPANVQGVHVDPASLLRNDGFSPGSTILVSVPNLDLATSGIPGSTDVGASLRSGAPVVLLDATTMTRLAYWGELDARNPNPATRLLMIHPAANLPEGSHIIVALRGLKTSSGAAPAVPAGFAAILAGHTLPGASGAAVTAHTDQVLATLSRAGVGRQGLYLAWDFTVISTQNLTGWMIAMRDQAFTQLGSKMPPFTVTKVVDFTTAENPEIARQVLGTFSVPSFLNQPGGPMGSTLNFGPDGLPAQLPGNTQTADFACLIPRSADANPAAAGSAVRPGRPVLYGKGLFSVATQMDAAGVIQSANQYDLVQCSTNSLGLTGHSEIFDAGIVQDLSNFATLPDHLQQAILDNLFLERLLASPKGLAANGAFRAGGTGAAFINTSLPLTYYGNSEGSLMGGAITAVSTQIHRAVLGVPSMDYGILLDRSVDFTPFFAILDKAYPTPSAQQLGFDLLQMIWDRGETNGYVEQLTDHPLPGTPPHQVLLQMAYGDHQVSNVTTEIEARTLQAKIHTPVLRPGRAPGNPFWGIAPIPSYPYRGPAALVVWDDTHVAVPPAGDVPPSTGPDPHDSVPRAVPAAQQQFVHFLETGQVINVCGNGPCVTTLALKG